MNVLSKSGNRNFDSELSDSYLYDPGTTDVDFYFASQFGMFGTFSILKSRLHKHDSWYIKYIPLYFVPDSKSKYDITKEYYNIYYNKFSYTFSNSGFSRYTNSFSFFFVLFRLPYILPLVSFYVDRFLNVYDRQPQPFYNTEIIGNVIDLCPVGALTSKPYSFTSRPWELVSTESIDIFDSLCSNIRVDSRGSELIRVLPRLNSLINNE